MRNVELIPASDLRVGDKFMEGSKERSVGEIEPCGRRDHIHINKKDCYWAAGLVAVVR